jgi:NADPH:quinone reductase-like Zn-dependent oxidoreductase
VLVRVHAASIHVGDWILMTGTPRIMRFGTGLRKPKNSVPGTDIAGIVEAIGPSVQTLRPGDEVFGWCSGAFAEYASAPADQFVKKPANLTFEQAAAVGVSATTALQLLRGRRPRSARAEGPHQRRVGWALARSLSRLPRHSVPRSLA